MLAELNGSSHGECTGPGEILVGVGAAMGSRAGIAIPFAETGLPCCARGAIGAPFTESGLTALTWRAGVAAVVTGRRLNGSVNGDEIGPRCKLGKRVEVCGAAAVLGVLIANCATGIIGAPVFESVSGDAPGGCEISERSSGLSGLDGLSFPVPLAGVAGAGVAGAGVAIGEAAAGVAAAAAIEGAAVAAGGLTGLKTSLAAAAES